MTTSRKPSWSRALRALIKTEHGFGWSIREHLGKVQLTRRRDEALTGHADRHHEDSVPIKPEQLAALLDALREAGKAELHLAVSLVGLFGLRPAELGVLRSRRGGCMWAT
jgi:hypothetical protein